MSTANVADWAKDAVFYQIFPERFANGDQSNDPPNTEPWGKPPKGNNYFGGDLAGIMSKMSYLKDLGITALYLNPIFEAQSNHKYNTRDYSKIDPSFGTNREFDEFIMKCRANGIRTVLDGVFNHVGTAHFAFEDVVLNGAKSKYASWFNIYSFPVKSPKEPNYECWWGYGSLPKLMVQNPDVKKYLFDVIKPWTDRIDGWRLDVPNEIPHEFWKEFRKYVRSLNPQCYIVGELWEDASPWLQGDEFDATMNYRFRQSCLDYYAFDKTTTAQFDKQLEATRNLYSKNNNLVMQNLLSSHDTERYLTLCQGEFWRMKLSVLLQMTYIGAPMIYYGDEIGMEGGKDPDCRRCMEWDPKKWDTELHGLYKKLIKIRQSSPALRRGTFRTLLAENSIKTFAFERQLNSHLAYVAINKRGKPVKIEMPVHPLVRTVKDELSGETFSAKDEILVTTIPARSARIFITYVGED
jgi:cyclomaltodextrinase